MERYKAYKDSGEKWLGEIPSNWNTVKSKYLWTEVDKRSECGEEQLLSVSQYDGVTPAKGESRSETLEGYKLVKENNLVINIMLAWLGGLGVSKYDGIVSPAYCVYQLQKGNDPRYLHYLYKTPMYLAEFARHSSGIVPSRWRMYTEDFGQVITLLPPLSEQERIVSYLDEQTSKIDTAIGQQQKMIDLLNERKQIIINNAVTKGLNPNAKMKDSGVDWIGEIPEGWEVSSLKYICTTNKILVNPNEKPQMYWNEYSMPAYDENKQPVRELGNNIDSSKILLTGPTLLVNKLNVHKKRIWFVECPVTNAIASTEFVPLMMLKAYPPCVELVLTSNKITEHLLNNSNGATNSQKRVSPNVILGIKLPLAPIEEQEEIVNAVKKRIKPIDNIIINYNKQISTLQERKQIIINEVVTGKVKV